MNKEGYGTREQPPWPGDAPLFDQRLPDTFSTKFPSIITAINDQTRRLEEAKRAYEELKALDEYKSNIISNVSHEIRTPITIAAGYIELAQTEEDPKRRGEFLGIALDALERQDAIVEDLIEAANLERRGRIDSLGRVDIGQVISTVICEVEPMAAKKKVRFDIGLDGNISWVKGDRRQVQHALRNIISNAVKFNTCGGEVIISLEEHGDTLDVVIKDSGIGIPEEIRDRIFERFYQGDSSPTRRYGGTGLGLAIAKEIIESMGGSISFSSEKDRGTCFRVTLPTFP